MKVNVKKIQLEIERAGWSVPQLAKKIGIPRQTLYSILQTENARLTTLTKIGEFFELDPKDLLI